MAEVTASFTLSELAVVASSSRASFARAARSNLCLGMMANGDEGKSTAVLFALGVA
jgi:hypothetical protein